MLFALPAKQKTAQVAQLLVKGPKRITKEVFMSTYYKNATMVTSAVGIHVTVTQCCDILTL